MAIPIQESVSPSCRDVVPGSSPRELVEFNGWGHWGGIVVTRRSRGTDSPGRRRWLRMAVEKQLQFSRGITASETKELEAQNEHRSMLTTSLRVGGINTAGAS